MVQHAVAAAILVQLVDEAVIETAALTRGAVERAIRAFHHRRKGIVAIVGRLAKSVQNFVAGGIIDRPVFVNAEHGAAGRATVRGGAVEQAIAALQQSRHRRVFRNALFAETHQQRKTRAVRVQPEHGSKAKVAAIGRRAVKLPVAPLHDVDAERRFLLVVVRVMVEHGVARSVLVDPEDIVGLAAIERAVLTLDQLKLRVGNLQVDVPDEVMNHLVAGTILVQPENRAVAARAAVKRRAVEFAVARLQQRVQRGPRSIHAIRLEFMQHRVARAVALQAGDYPRRIRVIVSSRAVEPPVAPQDQLAVMRIILAQKLESIVRAHPRARKHPEHRANHRHRARHPIGIARRIDGGIRARVNARRMNVHRAIRRHRQRPGASVIRRRARIVERSVNRLRHGRGAEQRDHGRREVIHLHQPRDTVGVPGWIDGVISEGVVAGRTGVHTAAHDDGQRAGTCIRGRRPRIGEGATAGDRHCANAITRDHGRSNVVHREDEAVAAGQCRRAVVRGEHGDGGSFRAQAGRAGEGAGGRIEGEPRRQAGGEITQRLA